MSYHFTWQSAVLKSDLTASEKLVLLVVGTFMNMHGDGAFPSYSQIASSSSLSRRKVIEAIGRAEELGWLRKVHRSRDNGSSTSNEYAVSFPIDGGEPGALGGEYSAPGGERGAPGVVNTVHQGGEPGAPHITPQLITPDLTPHPSIPAAPTKKKSAPKSAAVWEAYSAAYFERYGTEPVRNATVNSQLAKIVDAIGEEEAIHVARFYLQHNNRYYVQQCHAVGPMLKDITALRTQWATNTQMTESKARTADRLGNAGARMNQLQFNDEERF